ncbi:three component ABC system middle component [Pectobacterium aquaticum]|uniref:Uncharacterized protein n=1 Tax=Pectobacterium aquaticum TaxID=2204145 RepID=A0A426IX01_9GAMM|nr:three component ABC system middle component [Pectobacterium aquaticum]RRO01378.1 hypothetical protein DMB83_014645 [Pectobacterium aquaticum]RRO05338.1 hypothetical protein DMB85_017700 [Pectobacterium aquaticum]
MNPTEIKSLIHSPLWIASLLRSYISGAQDIKSEGINFELTFLALPFLLNDSAIKYLESGNKNSNISKIMTNHDLRSTFVNVRGLVEYYKPITKKGIIALSLIDSIEISNSIRLLTKYKYSQESNDYKKKHYKAAYNLGAILAKEDPLELLVKFGVY